MSVTDSALFKGVMTHKARCACGAIDVVCPRTVADRLCDGCHEYTCPECQAVVTYVCGHEEPESLICKRCVGREMRA